MKDSNDADGDGLKNDNTQEPPEDDALKLF
jgi:hypothetical protein